MDEASKANLNNTNALYGTPTTTTTNLLQSLPQMTTPSSRAHLRLEDHQHDRQPEWRQESTPTNGLNPPYVCKMTNFDTIGELRMVYGMNLELLYGEDANLNGALDPNENDGMTLPPQRQ